MKKAMILSLILSQLAAAGGAFAGARERGEITRTQAVLATNAAVSAAGAAGMTAYAHREAAQAKRMAAYLAKTGQYSAGFAKEARLLTGLARASTGLLGVIALEGAVIADDLVLDGAVQDRFAAVYDKVVKPGMEVDYSLVKRVEIGQEASVTEAR